MLGSFNSGGAADDETDKTPLALYWPRKLLIKNISQKFFTSESGADFSLSRLSERGEATNEGPESAKDGLIKSNIVEDLPDYNDEDEETESQTIENQVIEDLIKTKPTDDFWGNNPANFIQNETKDNSNPWMDWAEKQIVSEKENNEFEFGTANKKNEGLGFDQFDSWKKSSEKPDEGSFYGGFDNFKESGLKKE